MENAEQVSRFITAERRSLRVGQSALKRNPLAAARGAVLSSVRESAALPA